MHGLMVRYEDKLITMNEQLTLAPPICRLAGEFLSIDGEYLMQKVALYKVGTAHDLSMYRKTNMTVN